MLNGDQYYQGIWASYKNQTSSMPSLMIEERRGSDCRREIAAAGAVHRKRQQERRNERTRKFRDQMNRKGGYNNRCACEHVRKKGKLEVKERIKEMHVEKNVVWQRKF